MDFLKIKEDLLKLDVGRVVEHEPMYKHTTFKVGGPAHIYVEVKDIESIKKTMTYLTTNNIPLFVLGKGSNILFSDKEFEGVVLSLTGEFLQCQVEGLLVRVGAGASMVKVAYDVAKVGLEGLEFMSGIPGTIGGGVYMNAGAYKSDFSQVIKEVTFLNDEYECVTFNKEQVEFSYRHSIFRDHPNWIILEAVFELDCATAAQIKERMDQRKERRMASQPWNMPSAGSVFVNPDQNGAWYYIDQAGLRGYTIGGAQVSLKHSNFIVNVGNASAKDIDDLIRFVQKTVKEKSNIDLKTEVIYSNW